MSFVPCALAALRALPPRLPGKLRFAQRFLLPRLSMDGPPFDLAHRCGASFVLPSLDEPMAHHLLVNGVYEPAELSWLARSTANGGTLIDVGAGVGLLSLPLLLGRNDDRVLDLLAFEPSPRALACLRRNAQRIQPRVEIFDCALGSEGKETSFHEAPDAHFGMSGLQPVAGSVTHPVLMRSLDSLLDGRELRTPVVLKIDVEGAELGVLQGARKLLGSAQAPSILFEFVDWAEARHAGQQAGDTQRLLLSLGYSLFELSRSGGQGRRLQKALLDGAASIVAHPPKCGAQESCA